MVGSAVETIVWSNAASSIAIISAKKTMRKEGWLCATGAFSACPSPIRLD